MNNGYLVRLFLSSFFAISLLIVLFGWTYSETPRFAHQLKKLTERASELNLKMDQAVVYLKLNSFQSYDRLNELSSEMSGIIDELKQARADIEKLDNHNIEVNLDFFYESLKQKQQKLEAFKTYNAIYNSSNLFVASQMNQFLNSPISQSDLLVLYRWYQQLLKAHLEGFKDSDGSLASARQAMMTMVARQSPELQQSLQTLLKHSQKMQESGREVTKLVKDVTALIYFLATETLHHSIEDHYRIKEEKARAVQNILFCVSVLGVAYVAFLLVTLFRKNRLVHQALQDIKNQQFALDQHAIVSVIAPDGHIRYVNDKFCELTGFSRDELYNRPHVILTDSDYHEPEFFKQIWKRIKQGKVWHGEIKNKKKSGDSFWLNGSVVPYFDDRGNPLQFISIQTDITKQKALEEELLEQTQFMDQLTSTMTQGVYAVDSEGYCTFWNKGAERILGWESEQLLGKKIEHVVYFRDKNELNDRQEIPVSSRCIYTGQTLNSDKAVFGHRNGQNIPVSITATPLIETDIVIGSVAVFSDITEQLQYKLKLESAIVSAQQANKAKSEFLANMSHEIRTPMNGIIGMTELALDTDLNEEQRDYLEIVRDSSSSLLKIINDILDFSKIEAGKLELESIEFNLHSLLKETIQNLSLRAYEKNLELILDLSTNVPAILFGDPGRLRQVLTNLLGNAIKFTEEGEIILQVSLSKGGDRRSCIQFDVIDSGVGISPERQKSIFEAFSQEDASTSRKYGGTGLGLSISTQLIHLMDGEIWLTSELGKGSTFSFNVWCSHSEQDSLHEKIDFLKQVRVLLVDDNDTNQKIIKNLLLTWGMDVRFAYTPEQALSLLKESKEKFRILIVDVSVDNFTGLELIKTLKTRFSAEMGLIALVSRNPVEGSIEECRKLGVTDFIYKPLSHSDILDVLMNILGFDPDAEPDYVNPRQVQSEVKLKILVAEDNPINQKLAVTLLTKQGHEVTVADNGVIALKAYKNQNFDLILMDFQMPEMDGLAATREIRKIEQLTSRHIPIVAMTANAMKEDRQSALDAGMDDYISKPIDSAKLIQLINDMFTSRSQEPVLEELSEDVEQVICNWEMALQRLENDLEILTAIASMFVDEYDSYLNQIQEAYQNQEWDILARELHSLKGVLMTVGSEVALSWVEDCEYLLKNKKIAELNDNISQIRPLVEELVTAVKAKLECH
jgi:PAS domain S-box-containing protein